MRRVHRNALRIGGAAEIPAEAGEHVAAIGCGRHLDGCARIEVSAGRADAAAGSSGGCQGILRREAGGVSRIVYRAHDTRLGREVALKILPPAMADDPMRRARFQTEARALAALNHTNIAAIYGIEDGALVMELVPGATLDEGSHAGPIPIEEALEIARTDGRRPGSGS